MIIMNNNLNNIIKDKIKVRKTKNQIHKVMTNHKKMKNYFDSYL